VSVCVSVCLSVCVGGCLCVCGVCVLSCPSTADSFNLCLFLLSVSVIFPSPRFIHHLSFFADSHRIRAFLFVLCCGWASLSTLPGGVESECFIDLFCLTETENGTHAIFNSRWYLIDLSKMRILICFQIAVCRVTATMTNGRSITHIPLRQASDRRLTGAALHCLCDIHPQLKGEKRISAYTSLKCLGLFWQQRRTP
jgi:hypothetical protein